MAATYVPSTATTFVKKMIKNMKFEDIEVRALDSTLNMIWMAAPWRWTLGAMSATTLVASTQDYTVALPSDFLFLVSPYLASGSDVPKPLTIEPVLPADVKVVGLPTKIATSGTPGTDGTYRLMPKPGTVASPVQQIISLYKKSVTPITASNKGNAGVLIMPDEWAWVFESGVLYFAYLYADDQRAGGASVDPSSGRVQYSGQRATFEANLLLMKEREALQLLDPVAAQEGRGERK